ncbi:MAG: hypothetical protein ACOCP4_05825 [Candidatus Woesearchaeota archaeon]
MFLTEKIHKFYYQQKFFNAARKYPLELRRMILKFLQGNGATGFKGRWSDENIDMDKLDQMDPKEKAKKFKYVLDNTDINRDFFSASKSSYRGKIEIVPFVYKNKNIKIEIATNEEFFIEGHDLIINIKNKDDNSYGSWKQYLYKTSLMNSVENVLNEIWDNVKKSIKRFEAGDEGGDKEESGTTIRARTKSDIERMVQTYLQHWTKKTTLKSGRVKKTKYTDFDKLPVEFSVKMRSENKEHSTLGKRANPPFSLQFRVKKTSRPNRKKLTEAYPDIQKWYEIYSKFMKEYGKRYTPRGVERFFEGWSLIDESHEEMFDRLKFVAKRLLKQGYVPYRSMTAFKKSEPDEIQFKYSEKVKKAVEEKGDSAIKEYMDKYFKENVDRAFHRDKIKLDDIPRIFIKKVLETEPRG